MATTSRKATIQRPASAMAKSTAAAGYEVSRPPVPASPGSRSSKSTSKSERRRSLPAPPVSPPVESFDVAGLPDELIRRAASATASLYERRRSSGIISPTMTLSSARSVYSDRGYDRSRDRSIASTEETLSIHRLRSNSGLSLHTNSAALRRYTDYNADGSTRLPPTDERFDSDGRYGEELIDSNRSSPGLTGSPTTPKLFSWETVRAVLDDPMSRHRLWEYTRACGGAENLDFLEKVEQYNKALHSVTALMANISTTFTSVTASQPLSLPPHLSKHLNADIKHVSSSILPGLEMLFGDVDAHIKERIVRQIYPDFAKRQLTFRMKSSLGAASAGAAQTPFRFEGLGQAFCLTDPYRPDNPIVYASDSFARVMGYGRSEDIPRTGRFFRGPELNDEDAFSEELVVTRNHRDNRPFWSLVSGCPLKTANGRVRFVLSGLVDVTDAVKTPDDIVHALSAVPPTISSPSPSSGMNSASIMSRGIDRPASAIMPSYDAPTLAQLSKPEKPSPSRSFFNPFSRKRRTDNVASPPSRGDVASPRFSPNMEAPPRTAYSTISPRLSDPQPLSAQLDNKLSIYSRFMVLQFVPGSSHGHDYASLAPPPTSRRNSRYGVHSTPASPSSSAPCRLKVAFSSLPMLDILGLGPAAQEAVMYHDVFAVLSELAGSPSISPVFRANVRQRMVSSESASVELSIPASGMPAPGAFSAGLGAGLASPANFQTGSDESGTGSTSRRSSLILSGRSKQDQQDEDGAGSSGGGRRKRSGTYDRPPTSDRRGRELARMQRLMSHWTPLKDVDGSVAWVILVMSPVVEQ